MTEYERTERSLASERAAETAEETYGEAYDALQSETESLTGRVRVLAFQSAVLPRDIAAARAQLAYVTESLDALERLAR